MKCKHHALIGTKVYRAWVQMRRRVRERPKYASVGVCARWDADFMAFYGDMGAPPTLEHTLDRVDNEVGYSPTNCRWATPVQQARNRSSNRILTVGSHSMCVAAWCERLSLSKGTVLARLRRWGSAEHALAAPAKFPNPRAGNVWFKRHTAAACEKMIGAMI